MNLSRQDVDQMLRAYNRAPSSEAYFNIKNWYEDNINYSSDKEYTLCVYLFLLGANLVYKYTPVEYKTQMNYIKEIREHIDNPDPIVKLQRKTYLELGSKAGYYK